MVLHRLIRLISSWALSSFFTEVRVIGGENVPKDGPIIVTATHHNMMIDPAILSVAFPHGRMLNYWSKASLFTNPILRFIMYSSGNIPVDRKSKDRQVLFKGTFEALAKGQAVALFPEGTSYTEPRIMQVKDGAAWSSLEYAQWRKAHPGAAPDQDVVIVPASIVYTNKTKYRSDVILEFGRPITMEAFKEQFFSDVEGAQRAAVKSLTRTIENELVEATINAPDWDTLYTARMARDLLWEGEKAIKLDEFVVISQTLVDIFSTSGATSNLNSVKRHLLEYYSLLQSSQLTNSVLSSLPLPRSLDPNTPTTVPGRLFTLLILVRDSVSALIGLPFFLFPLIVHMPVYIMGRMGARLVEDEEETQAQNKVVFGLLSLLLIYPAAFFFLWALFWYTPIGGLLAAATVYLFAIYHIKTIDANYQRAKRLIAAWRILVGVWAPKRWDLSLSALSQYTTPKIPPDNPWIDRSKTPTPSSNSSDQATDRPPMANSSTAKEPPVKTQPGRRPPSRRIVRHVLRTRVEAVKALASLFDQLERMKGSQRLKASPHLAKMYGGFTHTDMPEVKVEEGVQSPVEGWRDVHEVIRFLKERGAKIPSLGPEEDWAVLSTDGEGDYSTIDETEPMVWMPPSSM